MGLLLDHREGAGGAQAVECPSRTPPPPGTPESASILRLAGGGGGAERVPIGGGGGWRLAQGLGI